MTMPNEEKATTPEAASPPVPPEPEAGSPPPATKGGGAASGAEVKPLSAKEHAAIEKAKYEAREARRALKEREARHEADIKAERDARAKLDADLADLRKQMEALSKGNPLKGRADAEQVIREFVEGETPERRTAAEIAEAKRVAEEAIKRADRIEAERKKEREDQTAAQREANKSRAVEGFAQAVTSGDEAKKYAYLNAMHTRTEIRAMASEIQDWAESEGKTFTYEQVALHLDKRAKGLYDERKERLDALRAVESGGSAAAGLAPPAATGRAGSSSAGNGHRNGPGTDASPKKLHSARLTRQQEEEEDLALLRKASAADAAERNRQAKTAKQH